MPEPTSSPDTAVPKPSIWERLWSFFLPTRLLLELSAAAVCIVLLTTVLTLAVDQVRHWVSESYSAKQAKRRDFFCAQHFDPKNAVGADAPVQLRTQREVERLLETARLRASPTDSAGKLRNFFLCSSVSKISLQSVEFASAIGESTVLNGLTSDTATEAQGRLKAIKGAVSGYPDVIYDRQLTLLTGLIEVVEKQVAFEDPVLDPIEIIDPGTVPDNTEGSDPGESGNSEGTVEPSDVKEARWLLIAGADQTDAAALDEVKRLQVLVDGLADAALKEQAGDAQIYRVRSWRRTVVPFASKEAAEEAFKIFEPSLPYGGYLRAEAAWCAGLVPMDTIGDVSVTRCGPDV